VCSAHRVVSNYIPCEFYPETLEWHVPLCCANWAEEARVKQRVAYGFSILIVALEIYLPLRALELGNAWIAIIMDTRNERTATHYPAQQNIEFSTGSVIMVWLYWQGSTPTAISLARTLIFMEIASMGRLWDSILIMQPSTTLVLAVVPFRNCTHLNGYHFTLMCPSVAFVSMQ